MLPPLVASCCLVIVLMMLPALLSRRKKTSGVPVILSEEIRTPSRCQDDDLTYLWRIESRPPAFILGSLEDGHEFEAVYETLSANTKAAFLHSDVVHIDGLEEDMDFQIALAQWNESFRDLLPSGLKRKLDKFLSMYCQMYGAEAAEWVAKVQKLKPGWVAAFLDKMIRIVDEEHLYTLRIFPNKNFAQGLMAASQSMGKTVEILTTDVSDETFNNMPYSSYAYWIQERR